MAEQTWYDAVAELEELTLYTDRVIISDGAEDWDFDSLKEALQDDEEIHDLAVDETGITVIKEDGYLESVRSYTVYNKEERLTPSFIRRIEGWDHEDITELRDALVEFRELLGEVESVRRVEDLVDMADLPSEPVPDEYGAYPIWAMDKQGGCLVGETADEIKDLIPIMAGYEEKSSKN